MSRSNADDIGWDDLDAMTRAELAELAHMPAIAATADVLDDWLYREHGITSSHHHVGTFLELLADHGYRVTPIDVSGIVLPEPTE